MRHPRRVSHGSRGHGERRMAMSSLARVLPRGRPASEETPQAIGCGYRVGDIAEWGVSDVELEKAHSRGQCYGVALCCARKGSAPGCVSC